MLRTFWEGHENKDSPAVREFIKYEHLLFMCLIRIELAISSIYYSGQPFAQVMHDGGTLKDRNKYQSFGIKYISVLDRRKVTDILEKALSQWHSAHSEKDPSKLSVEKAFDLPGVKQKIFDLRTKADTMSPQPQNVAIFFASQGVSGKAPDVASMMQSRFRAVTKFHIKRIVRTCVSDAAANAVARYLSDDIVEEKEVELFQYEQSSGSAVTVQDGEMNDLDADKAESPTENISSKICQMHLKDKVLRWSFGLLERRKRNKLFDPFEQGKAIVMKANNLAKWFNYGARKTTLYEASRMARCPLTHLHVNVNDTRVLAAVRLLTQVMHKEKAIKICVRNMEPSERRKMPVLSEDEWTITSEFEGLGKLLGSFITLVQTEKSWTGGQRIVLESVMRKALDVTGKGIPVLDRPVLADPGPERQAKGWVEFTEIGQEAWQRAISELSQRMVANPLELDEIIAMFGDIRLSKDQVMYLNAIEDLELYEENTSTIINEIKAKFMEFHRACVKFEADLSQPVQKPVRSPPKQGPSVALVFGTVEESIDSFEECHTVESKPATDLWKMGVQKIAQDSTTMDWHKYVKEHGDGKVKLVDEDGEPKQSISAMDLFSIDIGPYYRNLMEKSAYGRKKDLAIFVSFLLARLGDNMAESWCERHIHICNQIMTKMRTSMHADLLNWLAVLRMNVDWIEQRKRDFASILKYFDMGELEGMTVLNNPSVELE